MTEFLFALVGFIAGCATMVALQWARYRAWRRQCMAAETASERYFDEMSFDDIANATLRTGAVDRRNSIPRPKWRT